MITLLHYNINRLNDDEMESYLTVLPDFMVNDIRRYQNNADRKSRLIARLMLYSVLGKNDETELINNWKLTDYQKPYIENWDNFNISHSGDIVLFAYGKVGLGIDIEKKNAINYSEILNFLHPAEQNIINESVNPADKFYEIWVKKEAFLKAIGIGISTGDKYCCTEENVKIQNDNWTFHPIDINQGYYSCLCTLDTVKEIEIKEFHLEKKSRYE